MKTTIALIVAGLAGCSHGHSGSQNAPIGPDFVSAAPRAHIDEELVASPAMNRIEPLDIIAFASDNEDLGAASVAQIDRAAQWLERHPDRYIVLEGHTDTAGPERYNERLSVRRIDAVRQRLLAWNVDRDRIVMIAYGERDAVAPLDPSDRNVVMFATRMPPEDVVAAQVAARPTVVATWSVDGTLHEVEPGGHQTARR